MLVIRQTQLDALATASRQRFEDEMVDHVRAYFTRYYDVMGAPTIRNVIRYGIERAAHQGFTTERNVCLYLNLMLTLGSHFDTDPQLPWVGRLLAQDVIADPYTRMNQLLDRATAYVDDIAGPDEARLSRSLLNARKLSLPAYDENSTGKIETRIMDLLSKIWPEKYARLEDDTVGRLIRTGLANAGGYGIASDRGFVLYLVLMFMAGSGFDRDPQFPWATKVLTGTSIGDESQKIDRLHAEAIAFLDRWLNP